MKISFACDHGGFPYSKATLDYLNKNGYDVVYYGTDSDASVDYPDYAIKVAEDISQGKADFGILICGTGIGMSIAANKVKGVRCAHVNDAFSAEFTRKHNDANIIALGGRIATEEEVLKYIDIFLKTSFEGGRHLNRVNKITEIENKYFK